MTVERLVDALGRQPHARVLGELPAQRSADLLRTPPQLELVNDELEQPAFSMIFVGRSRRRRTAAALWAWKGRYCPVGCRLRRSSRLIVDAERPSSRPIAVGPRPRLAKSAILTRSSSDKKRGEI